MSSGPASHPYCLKADRAGGESGSTVVTVQPGATTHPNLVTLSFQNPTMGQSTLEILHWKDGLGTFLGNFQEIFTLRSKWNQGMAQDPFLYTTFGGTKD